MEEKHEFKASLKWKQAHKWRHELVYRIRLSHPLLYSECQKNVEVLKVIFWVTTKRQTKRKPVHPQRVTMSTIITPSQVLRGSLKTFWWSSLKDQSWSFCTECVNWCLDWVRKHQFWRHDESYFLLHARVFQEFLEQDDVNSMSWPNYAPGCNPILYITAGVMCAISSPSSLPELWEFALQLSFVACLTCDVISFHYRTLLVLSNAFFLSSASWWFVVFMLVDALIRSQHSDLFPV